MEIRGRIVCALLSGLLFATAAHAAQRTFVASNGSDAGPCSVTAPCRSFATAIAHTTANGEVIVLDSAGYGPVTITQSVSIIAPPGVYAGVSVSSGTGITISGSGIKVSLRGLTVNSVSGTSGIVFSQGAELHLERIHVSGFSSKGINVTADASSATIDDSTVEDNSVGVQIGAPNTEARAYLNRVTASNNSDGIQATDKSVVNVSNSVASRNANGIHADTQSSAAGASAEINVDNCLITHNSNAGVRAINAAGASSLIRVGRSTITSNCVADASDVRAAT